MQTYHSFKNRDILEQFLRCKNWKSGELDYITFNKHVFTMHEYDSEGKTMSWGNKKLNTLIEVQTSNRYDKNMGFTDAKVWVFDNYDFLRNDIHYAE